jgi:quercetin dioxygenase-like cupin family protein
LALLTAAIVAITLYHARDLWATAAQGFTTTTLAKASLGEINVYNHFFFQDSRQKPWQSWQRTEGESDLYVQSNVWQPGGTTGWHTHLGHSLIIVTAGTVTEYEGDDPNCTPHVYTAGMGFVDAGGSHHVHIVRNEGDVEADAIAVQLIPSGQPRRIDAPDPGNCPF